VTLCFRRGAAVLQETAESFAASNSINKFRCDMTYQSCCDIWYPRRRTETGDTL
jgi:hypothetical protein